MVNSRWTPQNPTRKQKVLIQTVDIPNRVITALLSNQAAIMVAVWETPPLFRWPREGEVWTVYQENNIWMLDRMVDNSTIKEISEGESRLHASSLTLTDGTKSASLSLTEDGKIAVDGAIKKYTTQITYSVPASFTIIHNLGTLDYHVSVYTPNNSLYPLDGTTGTLSSVTANSFTLAMASTPAGGVGLCRVVVIG